LEILSVLEPSGIISTDERTRKSRAACSSPEKDRDEGSFTEFHSGACLWKFFRSWNLPALFLPTKGLASRGPRVRVPKKIATRGLSRNFIQVHAFGNSFGLGTFRHYFYRRKDSQAVGRVFESRKRSRRGVFHGISYRCMPLGILSVLEPSGIISTDERTRKPWAACSTPDKDRDEGSPTELHSGACLSIRRTCWYTPAPFLSKKGLRKSGAMGSTPGKDRHDGIIGSWDAWHHR
jgi:hypothetical protein